MISHSMKSLVAMAIVLPLLLLLAPLSPAADVANCGSCHEDIHVADGGHSDTGCRDCHSNIQQDPHLQSNIDSLAGEAMCQQCHEAADALSASVHTELPCSDCHGDGHGAVDAGTDVCGDCHRKADRLVSRSVHAADVSCIDCHEFAHSITAAGDPGSLIAPTNQIKTCGHCHQENSDVIDEYLTSSHGKALLVAGLEDAPGCSSCHKGHDIYAIDDEKAATSHKNSPEMCSGCHSPTFAVWKDASAHGQAWQAGNDEAAVCTHCHESHQFTSPKGVKAHLAFAENCGDCHEEYYTTYRDTFHGQATDLNMATAATCADCHKWHRNLPADDPASSVHPDNLAETCGACHDKVSKGFLSYSPHNVASDPSSNPQVYWVWFFMTGLLLAVFGFFGLHDLLWLQRSLIGMARGEFKKPEYDGPYVRRFSSNTIGLHLAVVTTFLLLALTGLPLKFHYAGWAQPLVNLLGGLEAARMIHRLAAIGTLAYAAYHLFNIFSRAVRGEKGIFWGFHSLVPQKQDVVDILHNMRYFLYLGPRPVGGRWTYWEKFDYMAVFWGIPIIGLSGLFLWYPAFFSQFFPGWVLNAAHVVHSDEALLATGFIFMFHFFHTHLRPESFPLDPVIFTGRMPLEKFKEERPLEYQNAVDNGELDSLLVDPPTPSQLRFAHIFGYSAMAIGVALIIGIFWGLISLYLTGA